MEPGGLQKEKGPKAQDRKRRAGRDDVVRSCLPSSLALYWKLGHHRELRWAQLYGPPVPPCSIQFKKNPGDYKGHTHTRRYTKSTSTCFPTIELGLVLKRSKCLRLEASSRLEAIATTV